MTKIIAQFYKSLDHNRIFNTERFYDGKLDLDAIYRPSHNERGEIILWKYDKGIIPREAEGITINNRDFGIYQFHFFHGKESVELTSYDLLTLFSLELGGKIIPSLSFLRTCPKQSAGHYEARSFDEHLIPYGLAEVLDEKEFGSYKITEKALTGKYEAKIIHP